MDNALMTIIGIFLAAVLIFVFPLMSVSERNDDIAQGFVQTATSEFVDKISVSGVIKPSDYEEYLQKLSDTGNTFDVEIEVQHLDENFGKKNGTASKDLIGENERYSTFTTEILDNMYLSDGTSQNYVLKKGDNVIITAKNTNKTTAQILRTFIYKVTGQGTYEISTISSSMVVNNGTDSSNIQLGNSGENEEQDEIIPGINRYQVIQEKMTWEEAELECEKMGGHLVTITSQAEQDIVYNTIKNTEQNYWIGGTDKDSEGTWKWVTGEVFLYENFGQNQPDDGWGGQDYISISGYSYTRSGTNDSDIPWTVIPGEWDDEANVQSIKYNPDKPRKYYFICEWEN